MKYHEFITEIQVAGNLDSRGQAEKAARATLEILGRRIGPDGKKYLRYPLPAKIAAFFEDKKAEKFGLERFFDLMVESEGVSSKEAETYARTVVAVLQKEIDEEDIDHMLSTLTDDYKEFFKKSRKHFVGRA